MDKADRPAGAAPDRARLHEAALRHLARYATTEAGLVRVLDRRIDRWARAAGAEDQPIEERVRQSRVAARDVASSLVRAGVVDDAAFAAARAHRLSRTGRSRRAVAAHLSAKGVGAELAAQVLPDPERELAAALTYARKRRLGPFRVEADPSARLPDLRRLARAGFSRDVAERVLAIEPDEAEALANAARRG